MDFRSIVILILSITLTLTFIFYIIQAKKQEKIKEINKENLIKLKLEEQSILERAQEEKAQLEKETQKYQSMLDDIQHNYELEKKRLDSEIIQKTIQVNKLKSDFDAKKQSLEELYEGLKSQKEEKLNEDFSKLEEQYNQRISSLEQENQNKIESLQVEVDKMKAIRDTLVDAYKREQEIKENQDFYKLQIPESDKQDIQKLIAIIPQFNNDQAIRKLIWTEYILKKYSLLATRVLGPDRVCGIYKITNTENNMAYIGQSTNMKDRWTAHIKAGLGIGTTSTNKFYSALRENGVWNYTFEVLEKCDPSLLDEREKYYIGFYKTTEYGYNTLKGNG